MAEIEITLPTVQYGNVKIKATPEEWGTLLDSPHSIGMMAATYVNLFTQGFRAGSLVDVSAPVAASQHDDMVKAHELLDEELGGVTEISEVDSVIEETVAKAAEIETKAPWNKTPAPAVKKPWEGGAQAPAKPRVTLDSSW